MVELLRGARIGKSAELRIVDHGESRRGGAHPEVRAQEIGLLFLVLGVGPVMHVGGDDEAGGIGIGSGERSGLVVQLGRRC